MRISIDLKHDNTIIVSGLLITEKNFSSEKMKESLMYVKKCIEKEKRYKNKG